MTNSQTFQNQIIHGEAAALTGRAYLGIELEERYCQLARRRLAGVARFCENRQPPTVGAHSSWDSQTANAA